MRIGERLQKLHERNLRTMALDCSALLNSLSELKGTDPADLARTAGIVLARS